MSPRRLALTGALALSGCAVITSPVTALTGHPYGGTALDVAVLSGDRFLDGVPWILGALDLPFAVTLDTALAPLALLCGLGDRHPEPPEPEAPRSWGEAAHQALDLPLHPALISACGWPVELARVEDDDPARAVLFVRGPQGERMLWITRWDTAEDAERRGLAARLFAGGPVSAVVWTSTGVPLDLLR